MASQTKNITYARTDKQQNKSRTPATSQNYQIPDLDALRGWQRLFCRQPYTELWPPIQEKLQQELRRYPVLPPSKSIFRAFQLTSFRQTKVVIMGQDPYPNPEHAMGLAFSVPETAHIPKSLRNIFRELHDDIGCPMPQNGDLTPWAKQGVLLLNSVLTVGQGHSNSHSRQGLDLGWEKLTDQILIDLALHQKDIVFLLWGAKAQEKLKRLPQTGHGQMIQAPHPSPLSAHRGFLGSRVFSRANNLLKQTGKAPIDWCLKL